MKNFISRTEEIPVVKEYDVIVAGGGPAGVSAALCAARMGAKTLIVEQFNCLGGVATAGGHGHICLYSAWDSKERVVGGIIWEIARRTAEAGFAAPPTGELDFQVEGMKLLLEKMAGEAGVDLLYHTFFSDVILEGDHVSGVIVQNKNGRQAYRAKRVIDCTGDGDVAARAGCAFDYGDDETHRCQPVTLMFTIGGIDIDKINDFKKCGNHTRTLERVWAEAQRNGDMRPFQRVVMGWWWTPTMPTYLGVNFTHVNDIDSRSAKDLTAATIEARRQAYESIEVYRKYIPGMENSYMVSTPNTIGIRESRRILGEYVLTKDDILSGKTFEDSIGYGSFFIDIHNCSGPGMDRKMMRPHPGFRYQIPFRILIPETKENLLTAGRCVSVTHEALGSLRVMPQCGVMGQAAGAASVLSIRQGVAVRNVDRKALQAELKKQGCILDEADISAANR